MFLPVVCHSAPEEPADMKQHKQSETGEASARILIVEDEAIVAKDISLSLRNLRYHVVGIAATGEEAIGKAATSNPDIILMDIRLAGSMDGIETAREIHKTQKIPVVFLTAHADQATLNRAKTIAPFGYLVKPFAERELEAALETALYRASMERKLNDQRLWFESVLNCIGDAVIAADVNGLVTFINPAGEYLTGWKRDKAIGRELAEVFHTVDEQTRQQVEAPEMRALHGDVSLPEETEDMLLVAREGQERPITSTVSPINDTNGNLLGIVAVFRDLTARRQSERRAMNRQKMEALGKLSSNIAHDFNNIISLVAGYATSMQEYLLPDSRACEDVKRILTAVEHAGTLSKRILNVARASDAEGTLAIRPVLLSDAVRGATNLLRGTLDTKGIAIKDNVPDKSPRVTVDRDQFIDILVDIVLNSAEAMPKGGTITLDTRSFKLGREDRKLNPRAKPGPYAVLRIRDSGKGMSHETLDRIFEPFFTTKPDENHVGLGLSVVYNAIQRYGGWIRVSSKQDRGTTFNIYLPVGVPEETVTTATTTASQTILIVDDDESTRRELHLILKQAGFKILTAADGKEAVSLYSLHASKINLTILDVIMPGMDGRQVFEEITRINPSAIVLMLSGFSREYVRSYLPGGPWRFIQKPFEAEQIVSTTRRLLEQKPT